MKNRKNVVVVLCLVLFCVVDGVYENNPFLNGNNNSPGMEMPSNVLNVENMPSAKPEEPKDYEGSLKKYCLGPRGHFQSKYCNTFVDCWDDRAVEYTCPSPLYFNPEGYCDYPQNVNCNGKNIKPGVPFQPSNEASNNLPPSPVPVVVPITPQYPTYSPSGWPSDGSYKPPVASQPPQNAVNDGSWKPGQGGFDDGSYKPSQGGWDDGSYKPVQGSWDDGSYKPQQPSVHPEKPPNSPPIIPPTHPIIYPPVHVSTKPPDVTLPTLVPPTVVSTSSPINLPHLPANKYCKQPRGQFPGSACNKYVNCWDGIAVEQECPEGLNFNPYKLYCDYQWNYNCTHFSEVPVGPIIPTPHPVKPPVVPVSPPVSPVSPVWPPVSPPLLPLNKYCKEPRGQFPGSACNKYVNCWDGIAVEHECAEGLNFNPNKGYCDFSSNYNCKDNSGAPTTLAPATPVPPTSAITEGGPANKYCKKPRGQFPGSACNKYVNCWDGIAIEQECPEGFNFNPYKLYCDFSWNYNCTYHNEVPVSYTGLPSPLLTCKTGTIFSLKEDCSHMAICRNDLIEIVHCPQGLKYDVAKDSCMEPHLAKC